MNAFHKGTQIEDASFPTATLFGERYASIIFQRHYIELNEIWVPNDKGEEDVLFVLNDKRIEKDDCALEISEAQEAKAEFEASYLYDNFRDGMEAVIARTAEVGIELSSNYKGW